MKRGKKVCIVVGTRPEIIKMSSIIRYCRSKRLNWFVIDTAQHYDYQMSKVFFEQLGLPKPKYFLDASTGTHARATAKMIVFIEDVLLKERPDVVLVQGDTNTVLAGALASVKLQIPVGHVEAGLRSFDERMPEETNRILVDHMSKFLFPPTKESKRLLLEDGIPAKKIHVVGNTAVDAVYQHLHLAKEPVDIYQQLGFILKKDKYILVTAHRPENVDSKKILKSILGGLSLVYKRHGLPLVYPIHPRTKKMLLAFNLKMPKGILLTDPVSYFELLYLLTNARLTITDSGGIQEEACALKVPCVTMRCSTERPESVWVGANLVSGTDSKKISRCATAMLKRKRAWKNPFGDGRAAEKIMKAVLA